MNDSPRYPISPLAEVGGIPYFARMCDKIRLHASGDLSADYLANLGSGFDKWTCEFLRINYQDLIQKVNGGMDDAELLGWAVSVGGERTATERVWWHSYMRNRGYKDDLSDRIAERKVQMGLVDRDDIVSFFALIDADEGRI